MRIDVYDFDGTIYDGDSTVDFTRFCLRRHPAVLAGLAGAGLTAWLSNGLDTGLLRKLFGLFLLYIGLTQLLRKDRPEAGEGKTGTGA